MTPGSGTQGRGVLKSALGAGGVLLAGIGLVVVLLLVFGNGTPSPVGPPPGPRLDCRPVSAGPLPDRTHETSGLARGTDNPNLFWTHNDSSGDPILFAIGGEGALAGAVAVRGATATDWEDIEAAPCPGSGGGCLYIADTGDNQARRDHVTVYRVPEPATGDDAVSATPIHARYPDGPRDAEGLFIAGDRLHLVTKGRQGPIRVYRFPATGPDDDVVVTLEPLAEVAPRPETTADYVTAATTSPDGRWIALRTYRELLLFEAEPLLEGRPGEPYRFDLAPLAEAQGEGLTLSGAGEVWLTSEAGEGTAPRWNRLVCEMPEG